MTITLDIEKISKAFGTFKAVDDVSFEVNEGEIFALLGPNGAGKSTIIRMILDILKPDSGKITVLGGVLDDARKDRIGYLPEERGLYRSVQVIDMMTYLGTLKGMSRHAAKQRSMELLTQLGLAEHAKKKVSELSKGMQQKVQFAVTVMHNPKIIIIDEPFSGLDPINRLLIKDLLTGFSGNGGSIIMSTHQMDQVEEMADRMIMINKGQQKLYGRVDDIRRRYALHAIIVEGEGQWETLPGVAKVELNKNGRAAALLHLNSDATPDSVLAAIAASPDTRIERFELAVPSLNDIFIRVVEGGRNA